MEKRKKKEGENKLSFQERAILSKSIFADDFLFWFQNSN